MSITKTNKSMLTIGLTSLLMGSTAILSGCAGSSNETTSAIVGSVLGGAAGYQFGDGSGQKVATVLGAIAGGYIGAGFGGGGLLNQQDQQQVTQTLNTAPTNQKVAWNNTGTNTNYQFTPTTNPYQGNVNGQATQCRDYVMDAYIGGQLQQINGRACKNSSGQWVNAT